ncbi:MAG TPA: spore coat U domain-containing protein [Solimonas sp.]|nr:spore coat U domain-containing protein [Solimonas sp.]
MKRVALAAGLLAAAAAPSYAATATTSFNVTASVIDVCTVTASTLAFGTYNPIAATNLDGTSTVGVLCTLNTPYNVRLAAGTNGSSVTARKMIRASGTELMSYSLFRDSSRSQNWGVTDNTDTSNGTGSGLLQNITVYGRIPASENVPAGSYSDSVLVTVNY